MAENRLTDRQTDRQTDICLRQPSDILPSAPQVVLFSVGRPGRPSVFQVIARSSERRLQRFKAYGLDYQASLSAPVIIHLTAQPFQAFYLYPFASLLPALKSTKFHSTSPTKIDSVVLAFFCSEVQAPDRSVNRVNGLPILLRTSRRSLHALSFAYPAEKLLLFCKSAFGFFIAAFVLQKKIPASHGPTNPFACVCSSFFFSISIYPTFATLWNFSMFEAILANFHLA